MNLSGNDKNKITGKKYQPVMSITGLNDQGLNSYYYFITEFQKHNRNGIGWHNHL